jgi:hypothetical protein
MATMEQHQRTSKLVKEIRTRLEEVVISMARVLFFWVPGDVGKGHALMVLHICMQFWFIPFFILSNSNPLRFIILFATILIVASQWIFRSCIITRAERRLTGNNETIIDSFVTLMGANVNNDTLKVATIASGTTLVGIMIIAYICDYIKSNTA